MKIGAVKAVLDVEFALFYAILVLVRSQYGDIRNSSLTASLIEIGDMKTVLYLGAYMNVYSFFPHSCYPICVKFGVRDQYLTIFAMYEFCENQHKAVNEITFSLVM